MKNWSEFQYQIPDVVKFRKNLSGKRYETIDNTIYTFDIETSSFLDLDGKQINGCDYLKLNDKDKEKAIPHSTMYIWMFGINNEVYYGRTWDEFIEFLNRLEDRNRQLKIVHVHNLSFEFEFLNSVIEIDRVVARKSRKVMEAFAKNFNIMFKCSYFMTNCALQFVPEVFGLKTKKLVGSLDYDLIRTPETPLTEDELSYCEHDCLVIYEYIKKEILEYGNVGNIPMTSTGKVRRDLKNKVARDYSYKAKTQKAINTDPHIYNMLLDAFARRLCSFIICLYRCCA